MPKTAQDLFKPTDLDGQFLQSTGVQGQGDNFRTFTDNEGNVWEDVGSRTVHTTIDLIRASTTPLNKNILYQTNFNNCPGTWVVDPDDTESVDNIGTILVTAYGQRLKRKFSGDISAEWFGTKDFYSDNSFDNHNALQAAIDAAYDLNCNVELNKGTRYSYSGTLILKGSLIGGIARGVGLKMAQSTELSAKNDNQIMIRAQYNSFISGGRLFIGNKANAVGVLYWGGDIIGTPGNNTRIDGTMFLGYQPTSQRAILFAIGCDSDLTPIDSSAGQSLAFINVNARISTMALGIDMVDYAIKDRKGYINSITVNCNFNALAAIRTIGSQHKISGMFQPIWTEPFQDASKYFAYYGNDDNAGYNDINIKTWDWVDRGPSGKIAITVRGRGNTINAGSLTFRDIEDMGTATQYLSDRDNSSFNNKSNIIPPTMFSYPRILGNQNDILFYADKKYNLSISGSWATTGTFASDPSTLFNEGIGIYPLGAVESNPIVINLTGKNDSTMFISLQYLGIIFRIRPTYVKVEYLDVDGAYHTIYENVNLRTSTITYNVEAKGDDFSDIIIKGLRYTFYSSTEFLIERLWASIRVNNLYFPETYLPVSGGKVYGYISYEGVGTLTVPIVDYSIITEQTNDLLLTAYPMAKRGQQIICPNIEGGAQVYTLYDDINKKWGSSNFQLLP